ncbi:hypothetical protein BV898_06648, partial [Hypsibius exemplaris]
KVLVRGVAVFLVIVLDFRHGKRRMAAMRKAGRVASPETCMEEKILTVPL